MVSNVDCVIRHIFKMDIDNDSELERRAVEELLKEANRARVRAETMGPTGWMKCPLGSTNKRFLLNTLRSSALDRRSETQAATRQKGEERQCDGARETRQRQDKDHSHRKDSEHRREHTNFQCSRHHTSSSNTLAYREHSLNRSSQSKRTRSRSPVRDQSADKKSSDRLQK
ncbi:hypothetical protein P4O66_005035 [Electrophorus voltai]|uniref:Uncharacterized protein n=2 Tax=Electrophorus TaxID=8004 RepID=A0AAY5EGJ0_ELEEL|nr:protein POLR1D [Electrophorus electricus]KAK1806517.1 hypothetical protein P4O66_005035 [Electrophorus voltai]